MSDLDNLRRTIETNFRLNSLQTRELASHVNQQMNGMGETLGSLGETVGTLASQMETVTNQMETVTKQMETVTNQMGTVTNQMGTVTSGLKGLEKRVQRLGQTFESSMNEQADRSQETFTAISQILDNSVDLHKNVADHERRIRKLEERAS
jgi:methyl-accepting chemotaxis protein